VLSDRKFWTNLPISLTSLYSSEGPRTKYPTTKIVAISGAPTPRMPPSPPRTLSDVEEPVLRDGRCGGDDTRCGLQVVGIRGRAACLWTPTGFVNP